jgi:hypothetical protein
MWCQCDQAGGGTAGGDAPRVLSLEGHLRGIAYLAENASSSCPTPASRLRRIAEKARTALAALAAQPAQDGALEHAQAEARANEEAGRLAVAGAMRLIEQKQALAAENARREEKLRKVVSGFLRWADQKCPCRNEEPNPCPLCGASVENLEPCKAADNTLPRSLLQDARAALAADGAAGKGEGGANG